MKKHFLRLLAFVLVCVMTLIPLVSCGNKTGRAMLTLERDGIKVSISVNVYELLLSRMKGTLCFYGYTANGVNATNPAFWDYSDKFNGTDLQTIDEYYRGNILNNCRTFLVALYLFEKEGLKLSATEEKKIEERLEELVLTDGGGSKTKLNSLLAAYGANYNILREVYTIEAKIKALQNHLYGEKASKLGDVIKHEYMVEHYAHFRQVFVAAYHYVYETDKNGDVIYYYGEGDKKGHIYYDTFNGEIGYDKNGKELVDEKGDVIFFVPGTDCKKIAYNTLGTPIHELTEDGSDYKTKEMTADELAEVKKKAEDLFAELTDSDYTKFEDALTKHSDDAAEIGEFDDGYYLDKRVDYAETGEKYAYLDDIVNELESMQEGEVRMVTSAFGYHIIKKYPYTEKAYDNEVNTQWFENFHSSLIEELFMAECQKYYADIVLVDKVYADAPTMKEVGVNYYY
ncbi:MAG: hypothetical protein E7666_03305 [Ruminococcaceae bacterium]|nr:hypothetical protein [Oscillospiraceae bacterium]